MNNDRIDELEKRVEALEQRVFEDSDTEYEVSGKKLSLGEFIQDHDTSSHKKKVLVIGYFLENHEGQEEFTSEDIASAYRKAKVKPPATPTDIISKTAEDEHSMEVGEDDGLKNWVLTRTGEDRVKSELKEEKDDK